MDNEATSRHPYEQDPQQGDADEETWRLRAYLEDLRWHEQQEMERRLWEQEEQRRLQEEAEQQAQAEQELEAFLEWQEWQRQEEERRELEYLNSLSIEERRQYLEKRRQQAASHDRRSHIDYDALRIAHYETT